MGALWWPTGISMMIHLVQQEMQLLLPKKEHTTSMLSKFLETLISRRTQVRNAVIIQTQSMQATKNATTSTWKIFANELAWSQFGFQKISATLQRWQSSTIQVDALHEVITFTFLSDDIDLVGRCLGQFFGYDSSSCAHPCQTFQTKTKFLSEMNWIYPKEMAVKIKFSPKVYSFICDLWEYGFVCCVYLFFVRWSWQAQPLWSPLWTVYSLRW